MKILLLGPFVGSWEQEMLTFLPHARWISEIIEYDEIYISSHYNRKFLYDFIPKDNFVSIFEHLSIDETQQIGYQNNEITDKDYIFLSNMFKKYCIKNAKCNKKDLLHYQNIYSKNVPTNIITEQKIFKAFNSNKKEDSVVFIPDGDNTANEIIYNSLKQMFKTVTIAGDMLSGLESKNKILKSGSYSDNGYEKNVKAIMESSLVVTPCSVWTLIANLSGKHVISWGDNPEIYRENGLYGFNNKNATIIPDVSPENVIKQIKYVRKYANL